MTKPHFSSLRMDWRTPKAVYQVLDSEFQFDHDPCPAGWDGKIDGLAIDDKVYFAYRDERKSNSDRYGLGIVVAGGVTEEQHTTCLLDGLFVIFKTRKVTKVLVEMKDGENTERFLRKPSECFKVIDGGNSDA